MSCFDLIQEIEPSAKIDSKCGFKISQNNAINGGIFKTVESVYQL